MSTPEENQIINLIDIIKIIFREKILIFIIVTLSVTLSYLLFYLQKEETYWGGYVELKTINPGITATSFDFEIFEQNLKNIISNSGFPLKSDNTISFTTRTFDQFGNIKILDIKKIEADREKLISVIDEYIADIKIDIVYQLKTYQDYLQEIRNNNQINEKRFDNFMKSLDKYKEDGIDLNFSIVVPESNYQLYLSEDSFETKFTLEYLLRTYFSEKNSPIASISPIKDLREYKNSWKVIVLVGFFLGLVISFIFIAFKELKNKKII